MMMVRALECGGTFTWEHPSNRPLSDYTGDQIDLLCAVPSQMHHILQNIDTLPELDAILIGGSPIPNDLRIQIAIDVNAVLRKMQNRRYADIIRLLLIEGYPSQDVAEMLGMKVANVYNLKHRAIVQFIELYGQR